MKLLTTAAILMTMVMAMTTLEAQAPRWELVTEHAAFSPRDTAEDAVFLGKMWISNAYHAGGELVRDLWNSTDGVTWTKVLDNTPYDGYAEMAVFQGRLWAVKESVWNSADGVNWTKLLDKTRFGPRGYGELVVFKDELWQLGSGDDVWHSQDGVKWECAASGLPWGKRYGAAVAVYGGKLWLCGGAEDKPSDPPEKHYPQYTTHNDVWCSEDGVTWTLVTERARRRLERAKLFAAKGSGTVGAVAVDGRGRVAAATSTGGTANKRVGRVGDTPLLGCGTYADDRSGAVSCTGHGEAIMRVVLAKSCADRLAGGLEPFAAAASALAELDRIGGEGGLICADRLGRLGFAFNTERMARAWIDSAGREGAGFGRVD